MDKNDTILLYSDPIAVYNNAVDLLGFDINFDISTRKDKKYMVRGDFTNNKWVHFGQMYYEDYTKHKDKRRRDAFRRRNHIWANRPENTPSYLSYHLLW